MENNNQFNNNPNGKSKGKVRSWIRKNPKKFNIIMASVAGAAVLAAVLAPTLVAVSKRNTGTITVTFDPNGGTMQSTTMEVVKGQLCTEPAATKTGYVISCWKNGDTVWDFSKDVVNNPITLTAQWKIAPTPSTQFTIKFQDNGADEPVPDQLIGQGQHIAAPAVKKTGYKLKGWVYDGKAGYWDFKNDTVQGAMILKADWAIDTDPTVLVKITFEKGDHGSFKGSTESTIEVGVTPGITFANITNIPIIEPENGYLSSGWYVNHTTTKVKSNDKITSAIVLTAAYDQKATNITIKQALDQQSKYYGWTYPNKQTEISLQITSGQTFADIKNSLTLPEYDSDGYEFKFWSFSDAWGSQTEIVDDTPLTSNSTIYPCFEYKGDKTKQHPKLKLELVDNQYITEGDAIMTTDYIGPDNDPELVHTFAEINKPTVKRDGKEFTCWCKKDPTNYDPVTDAAWYQDPENVWSDSDKITPSADPHPVYAKFISPVSTCVVTFESKSADNVLWVGNQNVLITEDGSHTFNDIYKPLPFKDYKGSASSGFTSDYYLSGWHLADGGDVPATITSSITVCPDFSAKPTFRFALSDAAEPPISTIIVDPTGTWQDVNKLPTAQYQSTEGNKYFTGWKYVTETGEEEEKEYIDHPITPDTLISDIVDFLKSYPSKNIVPNYISDVNKVIFDTTGFDLSGTEIPNISYDGSPQVAVLKTQDVNFMSGVNKPTLADTSTYKFIKWKYYDDKDPSSPTYNQWVDVDYSTEIKLSTLPEGTETHIRPVVETKFTVKYDANGGTLKPLSSSETITETKATSSDKFRTLYSPDVTPADNQHVFSHWAYKDENEEFVKVQPNDTLPTPMSGEITLYAIYKDNLVSSIVNFHLTDADIADKDFPCTITGIKTTVNHKLGDDPLFSSIAKGTATKYLWTFDKWTWEDGSEIPADYKVPATTQEGIHVYAHFKQDVQYWKVTIKESTDYQILNDNIAYVQTGKGLPIVTQTGDFGIHLKWEGHLPIGYKYKDAEGEYHWLWHKTEQSKPVAITQNMLEIEPEWDDNATKQVTFTKNGDSTISGMEDTTTENCKYWGNLANFIAAKYPSNPSRGTDTFDCWKVVDSSGTHTVTSDYEVTEDITVYPSFIGESEFAASDKAYFFDIEAGKWAQITNFVGSASESNLIVTYADGTQAEKDKTTFNYEVKLGTTATEVPENFMQGCINWNNGAKTASESKPLVINNVCNIGKNFLQGCASFNQNVTISGYGKKVGATTKPLTVQVNFMRDCYAFNKNVEIGWSDPTVTQDNVMYISPGFMYNCQNFTGQIYFKNCYVRNTAETGSYPYSEYYEWENESVNWYSILACDNANCKMVTQGFTLKTDKLFWPSWQEKEGEEWVDKSSADKFASILLKDLDSSTWRAAYRKVIRA